MLSMILTLQHLQHEPPSQPYLISTQQYAQVLEHYEVLFTEVPMRLLFDSNFSSKQRKLLLRKFEKCSHEKRLLWDLGIEYIKKEILDQISSKTIQDNSLRRSSAIRLYLQ